MSTINTQSTPLSSMQGEPLRLHAATPSFFGIVRGELFKVSRQWMNWLMLLMLAGVMTLPYLVTFTVTGTKADIQGTPLHFLNNHIGSSLVVMRVFIGFFLLILTANVIGLEYQLGTIRILLARGVGKVQLLCAKLVTIVLLALLVFVGAVVLNSILLYATVFLIAGNVTAFNAITPAFWSDTQMYLLTVLISMGVTIVLATAVSVLGRSLAIGLSTALIWFPIDNFGTIFLLLAYRFTHNDFWTNVSAYLLGPNLNTMPASVVNPHAFVVGINPLVPVDGPHTLWVTLVYALIFIGVAFALMWRRDVKE